MSAVSRKWTTIPLSEAGQWLSGGTPSRSNAAYWGGSIPWISAKSLTSFELEDAEDKLTEEGAANGSRLVEPGTLLFVVRGMSLANEFRVGVTKRRVAFNQDLRALVPNDTIDARYLVHFLRSAWAEIQARIDSAAHGTKRLPTDKLGTLPVPLPPLPEQKRIAAILDKADAIRRKRQEAIRLTEELLRSAFLEMCGPRAKNYAAWPLLKFENLAQQEKGSMRTGPFGSDLRHSEFVDDGIAVLGIDNAVHNRFAWGERRFITVEKYERLKRYRVFPGDVIVTIMGTTGRSAVVPDDIPTAITTKHLATITLNRQLAEPEFVAQALHRHPGVLSQIDGAHRGAIMSGLNLGLIKALEIRVPPVATQREFTRVTSAIRCHEVKLNEALCQPLSDSLIQRAFSGGL